MRIEEVFADILQEPVDTINDDTSPKTTRNWDSLKHIQVVMAIEQAFGVSFTPPEVMTITSVGAVKGLLKEKGVDG